MLLQSLLLALLASKALAVPTLSRRETAVAILEVSKRENKDPRDVISNLIGLDTSYAPYAMPCPSGVTWVRPADSLSSGEQAFLKARQPIIDSTIKTQLANKNVPIPPRSPRLGLALSGGGYRAMINNLGVVMATMNVSSEAAASGVGGWLDAMTYMAGLSGGSWATGSFMANGGPLPTDLIDSIWNLPSNLVLPSDNKVEFYTDLVAEVTAKADKGFKTQITDYWALALADHLLPISFRTDTYPNLTFSNLSTVVPALGNASLPMPIIVATEREPGELVVAENATIWEFTPTEFGSWAFGSTTKVKGAFTPLEYLGSEVNNGQPNGTCFKGFDQLDFIMGTSSTLFNTIFLTLNASSSDSIITDAIEAVLEAIGNADNDVALYPNPFANWNAQPNPIANFSLLTLVDGGEDNANIPIEPLLTPYRDVDAVIAIDASADTTFSWPNGSSLVSGCLKTLTDGQFTSFDRAKAWAAQNQDVEIRMPAVPSTNGFINGGLNTRPTFFGCNDTTTPVVVYIPNYPWSAATNHSTFQLSYDNQTATDMMLSSMRAFTLNGSVPTWPTCLSCALTDRAFSYTSSNRTSVCQDCFNTWCWNGIDDSSTPSGEYEPVVGSLPQFLVGKTTGNGTAVGVTPSNKKPGAAGLSKGVSGALGVVVGAIWVGLGLL